MNVRVKQLRKELGMNQLEFGQRLGVSNGAISKIEKGFNGVSDQMRLAICREFGINREWLESGTGDMRIRNTDDAIKSLCQRYSLPHTAESILRTFVSLSPDGQNVLLDFIRRLTVEVFRNDFDSLRPFLEGQEPSGDQGAGALLLQLEAARVDKPDKQAK